MELDRNSAIIDLAFSFTGLVYTVHCTVTQSCLAHCILQGVEHTSPTGWSDSHLSIGDKYVWLFGEQLAFLVTYSIISDNNSITYISKNSVTLTTFQMHKIWLSTMYGFCCFVNSSSSLIIYFNNNIKAQRFNTKYICILGCINFIFWGNIKNRQPAYASLGSLEDQQIFFFFAPKTTFSWPPKV